MISNSTAARGFTLVEVLVALTIMAMVTVAVVSGLRTGLLVWDKGTNHIDELRRSRVAVELLHDTIGGALPFTYSETVNNALVPHLAFGAMSDRLRFVSRNSFKEGPDSVPRWIEVRWVPNPDKRSGELIVEERSILPPNNLPDPKIAWTGKLIQAESCTFDFLEMATGDKRPAWRPDWRPAVEQLPNAVRLRCVTSSKQLSSVIALDYASSSVEGLTLN